MLATFQFYAVSAAVVTTLVATAAAIRAIRYLWKVCVKPVIHAASVVITLAPVIMAIAKEFQNNGGSSLRDAIDKINAHLKRHDVVLAGQDQALNQIQSTLTVSLRRNANAN